MDTQFSAEPKEEDSSETCPVAVALHKFILGYAAHTIGSIMANMASDGKLERAFELVEAFATVSELAEAAEKAFPDAPELTAQQMHDSVSLFLGLPCPDGPVLRAN